MYPAHQEPVGDPLRVKVPTIKVNIIRRTVFEMSMRANLESQKKFIDSHHLTMLPEQWMP
jgi:hypothetical protein